MKGTRRYSIGAAIVDFYVAGIILGAVAGIYVAATQLPVPMWEPFLVMGLDLMCIIVYHSVVARKVVFRSVGEAMMGRVVVDGCKHWTNPYGINRTALFVVLFIALIRAGNSWDSVADERIYATLTFPNVLWYVMLLGCLLVGIVNVGRAQSVGGFLVVVYFTLAAVSNLLAEPSAGVSVGIIRGAGLVGLFVAFVAGVVLLGYYRSAAKKALGAQFRNNPDHQNRIHFS